MFLKNSGRTTKLWNYGEVINESSQDKAQFTTNGRNYSTDCSGKGVNR